MLRLNVEKVKGVINDFDAFQIAGKLHSVQGLLRAQLPAAVGELCSVRSSAGEHLKGEVIGFAGRDCCIMPYKTVDGLHAGATVSRLNRTPRIPVGNGLLGRVVNALGHPIDDRGSLRACRWSRLSQRTPPPLSRPPIEQPFITGQRVIDGLLTIGRGQRVGLFAGSGVGKSTLLGEIAKGSQCDVGVIALVGERGREVRPFLENCLGPEGLARSVVIVSTAEEPPLLRIRAVQTAIAMAHHFRGEGANVLLLLDSLTRLAMAQRELGLLLGEPPSSRGYPPSVFQLLSNSLEQLGNSAEGSITGILTVLVEGDDMDEPIADATRAIVDGHVVLDRSLVAKGHYPAINVSHSVSRLFRDVTTVQQQQAAGKIRSILSTHEEVAELLRVGAYTQGTSPRIDQAVALLPAVEAFLRQSTGETCPFSETVAALSLIAEQWED